MKEIVNLTNIFIAVSIFSTVLYILKLIIFISTGGDSEVDTNFDSVTEADTSFTFFSVQSLLAFFMGFGWSGLTVIEQIHVSRTITIIIAFCTGLIFMFGSAYLMYSIRKLNQTVKRDINELINKQGRTYTSFQPNGEGQIEIDFNNKLSILDAINNTNEKIDSFTQIKVEKIENNKIYIIKV